MKDYVINYYKVTQPADSYWESHRVWMPVWVVQWRSRKMLLTS